MGSKKCLIAWAIFLIFVLFLTSQVTAGRALPCRRSSCRILRSPTTKARDLM
ncbi:hypothetical protein ACOSQ2_026073 [Xanthoceras sorbifolium]